MDDDDNGSGYEAGSENTIPASSSEISLSDNEETKPCEICGSNENDDKIMTCSSCRVTREHIYCGRVLLHSVPPMWICEECSPSSNVAKPDDGNDSNETANSEPNHADDNEDSAPSRTNRVDNQNTSPVGNETNLFAILCNTLPSASTQETKPCEICGSNDNADKIMTCCRCRVTREHIYCAKVLLQSVPPMWLCEECRSSSRVVYIPADPNVNANSGPNHVNDDQESKETANSGPSPDPDATESSTPTNSVDGSEYSSAECSATNQPLRSQAYASPMVSMDTSPVSEQKQSDSDMPSDSESAK